MTPGLPLGIHAEEISAIPPSSIATAPIMKPMKTWLVLPDSIRCANSSGPTIPPAPVPTA